MAHGFKQLRKEHLGELKADMYEMVHEKTGLKLLWLDRDEENKTFGIAFPTFPEDDTGVFHIIEHSVLCGSKNYPVKDPFVELLKSSMNTFLNAMTFSDKTFYPISSKNDKDFINLMRVYLDAVFYPAIYQNPECFRQEGWHYEKGENGELLYKGVVFNEMKGVFADPDAKLETVMSKALFPDNAYGYVSGGDPKSIPELTYENFIAAHKKHYSPSNAFVILDGKMDIDAVLKIINDEYLEDIPAGEKVELPELQKAVDAGEIVAEYEISPDENADNRYILAWGRVVGDFSDTEKIVAVRALSDVLCGSVKSPLNACVLGDSLAEAVSVDLPEIVLQPQLIIKVQNLKKEDADEIEKRIFDTLASLAENGIDRNQLEAALTYLEFQMREKDYGSYPQGLVFGMDILDSWLYGGKPEKNLEVGELFKNLRAKIDEGYFEKIIKEEFIENPHRCKVMLVPSKTVGDKIRAEETERLKKTSERFDDEDWERVEAECEKLALWQDTPDTEEAVATLPRLTLQDIKAQPEAIPTEEITVGNIPTLVHKINSNGIVYVSLYFDANGCTENEISALSFATSLLGELATEKHSSEELLTLKRTLCGSVSSTVSCYEKDGSTDCSAYFHVNFSAMEKNIKKAIQLIGEVLTTTDFSNGEDSFSLLCQNRMEMLQSILVSGSQVAMGRTAAQLSKHGVISECNYGFEYYNWLKNMQENWSAEEFCKKINALFNKIICREKLTVSVTGTPESVEEIVNEIASTLPEKSIGTLDGKIEPWGLRKEGIAIPADVSFAVMTGDLRKLGKTATGSVSVAGKIVSLNYLWTVIRMQGGAYGTGMVVRPSGTVSCYSYRDPSVSASLESFKKTPDYLRSVADADSDITGFIIGTVADSLPVLTPRAKGALGDRLYFRGVSEKDRKKRMEQIVSTSHSDLKAVAESLEECYKNPAVCVVGNREQLEKCNLDTILSV